MKYGDQIAVEVRDARAVLVRIRQGLQAKIKGLPDNPCIQRLPGSPRCFTMSSKSLGNNWTVAHHDFQRQYELIAEELDRGEPAGAVEKLRGIIELETLRSPHGNLTLHPDVVAHLKGLLEGEA